MTDRLLNGSELRVDRILRHRLPASYRVLPCVRLQDVIKRDKFLPREEFDFFCFSHLDFVVASRLTEPIFAVEFDGPHHDDPKQVRRDILKNRLCEAAGLPLLRIRGEDTEQHERVSLLDYMLQRYLTWPAEHEALEREIAGYVEALPPEDYERLIEDDDGYDPWLDPTFRFDLRHPFPATKQLEERLLETYGVAMWDGGPPSPGVGFFVDVNLGQSGGDANEEFHRSESWAVVRSTSDPRGEFVFRARRTTSVRSWLRCLPESENVTLQDLADLPFDPDALLRRMEMMWFPDLPGIWPWHIAEHFSAYLALRAVEEWARRNVS